MLKCYRERRIISVTLISGIRLHRIVVPQELFVASSGKYAYKVTYNGSASQWIYSFNGTAEAVSNALGWTPTSEEYFGEVWATQDYVPGSAANPELLSQLQYKLGTWYGYSPGELTYNNGTPYGRFSSTGTDAFGIYDPRG